MLRITSRFDWAEKHFGVRCTLKDSDDITAFLSFAKVDKSINLYLSRFVKWCSSFARIVMILLFLYDLTKLLGPLQAMYTGKK